MHLFNYNILAKLNRKLYILISQFQVDIVVKIKIKKPYGKLIAILKKNFLVKKLIIIYARLINYCLKNLFKEY